MRLLFKFDILFFGFNVFFVFSFRDTLGFFQIHHHFSSFASKVALEGQIVCNCAGAGTAEINLDLEISDQQLASEKILVNVADTSQTSQSNM